MAGTAPSEYKDRFADAMKMAGKDAHAIAKDLGVTYQAIKKILNGGTKMPRADHSAKAAIAMNVDHVWLATGAGTARKAHVQRGPGDLVDANQAGAFEDAALLQRFARLSPGHKGVVEHAMRKALDEMEAIARSAPAQASIQVSLTKTGT